MSDLVYLPSGWKEITLTELGIGRTEGILPADFAEEIFELWSVPAFPTGEPEILAGSEIGSNKQRVQAGDVLLCKINPRINRVWKVGQKTKYTQIASTEWIVLRVPEIEPDFLVYRFREQGFRDALCADVSGVGGSLIRARPQAVEKLHLTLPPLNEQRRIVAKIEALMARSQRVKEALEAIPPLLDQFRQSVLAAAFRGDLTAEWREKNPDAEPASVLLERIRSAREHCQEKHKQPNLPASSILPKIPSGWLWVTVEHLGVYNQQTVLTGPFGATLGREDFLKNGVPVITIGCLQSRGLDFSKAMYISQEKANELERYKLNNGDFLFSRMASVGRAAIVEEDLSGAIFNYHLMRLRLSRELIETKYFLYYVRGGAAVSQYVKSVNHGATRDGINTQQLNKMPVALPPLEEQGQIVQSIENYFDRTHNIDDFVSGSLEKLQICNQSILAKAFRGELVPQDSDDEPASVLLERIRAERAKRETEAKVAKKSTGKTSGQRGRKAKQQDLESIQLGLLELE